MYLVCWVFKGVRNTIYQCSLSLLCELCLQPISQIHTLEICGNNRKCHWLTLRWWQVGVLLWDTTFLAPPCLLDEVAVTLGWSWSPLIGQYGGKPLLCWVGFWMSTRTLSRKSQMGMPEKLPQRGCLAELAVKRREGIGALSPEGWMCGALLALNTSQRNEMTWRGQGGRDMAWAAWLWQREGQLQTCQHNCVGSKPRAWMLFLPLKDSFAQISAGAFDVNPAPHVARSDLRNLMLTWADL